MSHVSVNQGDGDRIDLSWVEPMTIERGTRLLVLLLANSKLIAHFGNLTGDDE